MEGAPDRAHARPWGMGGLTLGLILAAAVTARADGAPVAPQDVLTFHGDNLRTGWQAYETALTPDAVASQMGWRWTSPVLDGDLYGQPLYVKGVNVHGSPRNVVYVATEADTVWALDAQTGAALWGPVSVGLPVPQSALPCGNIDPVGITGTPVADPASDTLYAVALTTSDAGATAHYALVALSLSTGAERPGFPVALTPSTPGGPSFDPHVQEQRGALSLLPGGQILDVPFGGYFGDCGNYRGWVQQVWLPAPTHQASYVTPTNREGGLWTAGGLAYGPEGALFGVTGNSSGVSVSDMGNSALRFLPSPHLQQPAGPEGFFAPSNAVALDRADRDLGSGGPLLLPAQPGPYPYLLFAMGKQGVGYLIDRWYPGGVGTGNGVSGEGVYSVCMYGTCGAQEAVFTTAAYYAAADGASYVITAGRTAQAKAVRRQRRAGGLAADDRALRVAAESGPGLVRTVHVRPRLPDRQFQWGLGRGGLGSGCRSGEAARRRCRNRPTSLADRGVNGAPLHGADGGRWCGTGADRARGRGLRAFSQLRARPAVCRVGLRRTPAATLDGRGAGDPPVAHALARL